MALKCGSQNTVRVCPYCGQAMCNQHKPSTKDAVGKRLNIDCSIIW